MLPPSRDTAQWFLAMVYTGAVTVIVFVIETSEHELSWVGAIVLLGILMVLMKQPDKAIRLVQIIFGGSVSREETKVEGGEDSEDD